MTAHRFNMLATGLVLFGLMSNITFAESSILDPLNAARLEQQLGSQVPLDLEFTNSEGKQVRLADLVNNERPVVLNLVYFECPMLCNMTMDGLLETLRAIDFNIGEDFDIITLSFDSREGPKLAAGKKQSVIKAYGKPEAAANWHFLTGTKESIRTLTDSVGFQFQYDPLTKQYAHSAGLIVLTSDGIVSRYLQGVQYTDLRLSIVEASNGNVSTVKDNILLLCYQYDPASGKYGFAVLTTIRLAGIAMVAVLAGYVIYHLRREKRVPSEPVATE